MKVHRMRSSAWISGLIALSLVLPASSSVAASKRGNTIHAIDVAEKADRTEITVVASSRPTFTVFKLANPTRLFIDIVDADLSKVSPRMMVRNGVIGDISVVAPARAGNGAIGRIQLAFDRDASYDIEIKGTKLVIMVDGAGRDRPDLKLAAAKAEAARLERVVARERKLLGDLRAARQKEEKLKRKAETERAQQEILMRRVAAARQQAERLSLQAKTELDRITTELSTLSRKKRLAGDQMAALARAIKAEKERKAAVLAERKKAEQLRRAVQRAMGTERSRLAAMKAATKRAEAEQKAALDEAKAAKEHQKAAARLAQAKARGHKAKLRKLQQQLDKRATALTRAQSALAGKRKAVQEARLAEAQASARLRDAQKQQRTLEKERRDLTDKRLAKERARVKALQQALAKKIKLRASAANERAQRDLARLEDLLSAQRRAVKSAKQKAEVEQARIAMLKSQLVSERKELGRLQKLRKSEEKRVAKLRLEAEKYEAEAAAARKRAANYAKQLKREQKATSKEAHRVADAKIAQLKAKLKKEQQAAAKARARAEAAERKRQQADARRRKSEAKRLAAEAKQKKAEARRLAADKQRKAAEAAQRKALAKSKAADVARRKALVQREAADAARREALAQKNASDAARREALAVAKAAEAKRRVAEARRKAAESAASKTEQQRVAADRQRRQAESRYRDAERARKSAIAKRVAADKQRQAAEQRRVAAEQRAVAARKQVKTSAPVATAQKAQVRDVAFRDLSGNGGEITIKLDGKTPYEIVRHSKRRIELKLFGSKLPKALERSLDASEFDGPIKLISSFRSKSEPGVTRVVIDLREDATHDIKTVGTNIVWAFNKRFKPAPRAIAQAPKAPPMPAVKKQRRGRRTPPGVRGYPGAVGAEGGSTAGRGGGVPSTRLIGGRGSSGRRAGAGRRYRGKRINVTIKDADIRNVLTFLAKEGGVNIVASDKVGGKVTFHLENVPWDLALDMILKTQGYDYVLEAGVYRVAPAKDIREEFEAEVKKKEALRELKPLVVRFISVNYANLKDLEKHIKGVLSKHGTVTIDQATSTILVKDVEEHVQAAEEIVRRLDVQLPQVLIEARIVEASTTFSSEFGIQWGGDFAMAPAFGNPTGLAFPSIIGLSGGADDTAAPTEGLLTSNPNFAVNLPAAVGAGAGGALGLTLGSIGGSANLNLRLSAAETRGQVKIVSAPKILTLDGNKALIQQGVSIPVPVVSANGVNTQFFDASLKLEVLTNTSPDGNIRLDIDIEKAEPDFGQTSANGAPTIQKKEANTSLLVRDGETTVIGGIFTRNSGYNESGVPVLSKIPILGWFFKNHRESDSRSELLIFITPRVLNRRASVVGQGQFSTGTRVEK